jgi:hypothetical protein
MGKKCLNLIEQMENKDVRTTAIELFQMLVPELISGADKLSSVTTKPDYFNNLFGDSSFLLAGILETHIKEQFDDWEEGKWIDDCLISSAKFENPTLTLGGVMIWGREDTTEQWTDPFSFEIELLKDEGTYKKYAFLFGHLDEHEITYEEFRDDREYWNNREKDWKYIIHS